MIARVRELDIANERVHGGNRRPEPEFVVDPAELAEWTARNRRAIGLNRLRPKCSEVKKAPAAGKRRKRGHDGRNHLINTPVPTRRLIHGLIIEPAEATP